MVSAELSHNPYLLETVVLFNGRPPQVNSAVRKYEHVPLVDWVDKVPKIFHDEMNGYGFDLYFTGTDADYESVRHAFISSGVPEDSVRVLRKGTIDDSKSKMNKMTMLLKWLAENDNSHLDVQDLFVSNPELTDTTLPLLVIHGEQGMKAKPGISIEQVDGIEALQNSDLTGTPILICVAASNLQVVIREVSRLIARKDVERRQLFFSIDRLMDKTRVTRVLSDLGVTNPQVVSEADDQAIAEYVREHLVAGYVRDAIRILDVEATRIERELQQEAEKGKESGAIKEVQMVILDTENAGLESTRNALKRMMPVETPLEYVRARQQFRERIAGWRSRTRMLEGETEAAYAVEDLERTVQIYLTDLSTTFNELSEGIANSLYDELTGIYDKCEVDAGYRPDVQPLKLPRDCQAPDIKDTLMAIHETLLVGRRHDIFAFFGNAQSAKEEFDEVEAYRLDKWRKKTLQLLDPALGELSKAHKQALQSYQQALVGDYLKRIERLIEERRIKKNQMIDSLSDEERTLQQDSDWLMSFTGKLQEIKRG